MKTLFLVCIFCFSSFGLMAQNCSQGEVDYLAQNAALVQSASQDCAFDCILAVDQEQCLLNCLSNQLALSDSCLSCTVEQTQCVLSNCAFNCINPNAQGCIDCLEANCFPDYFLCLGDNDRDGFTEAGGDCDNNDPSIHPNAEEIPNDGIDQNCDGEDLVLGLPENSLPELEIRNGTLHVPPIYKRIQVHRSDGREVLNKEASGPAQINLNELPEGIYIIRAMTVDAGFKTLKLSW